MTDERRQHEAASRGALRDRTVLIIDDDPTVTEVILSYLTAAGLRAVAAGDGDRGLALLASDRPDLVVLDRTLPGIDGIEVCRRIRALSDVPVLMLTGLGDEEDRIAGLEAGADDYLAKPFSPRELVLRVQSLLRRSLADAPVAGVIEAGRFRLRPEARVIERDGTPLSLTTREHDLLAFLLRRPNRVFGRAELLSAVWGWTHGDLSTVTVHMRRLREKLEDDPAAPRLITTVWGVGYRLDPDPVETPSPGSA